MTLDNILSQLKDERDRLDRAISALEGGTGAKRGRPPGKAGAGAPKKRRHMSAEARKKISEKMKKRWAERKKKMAA